MVPTRLFLIVARPCSHRRVENVALRIRAPRRWCTVPTSTEGQLVVFVEDAYLSESTSWSPAGRSNESQLPSAVSLFPSADNSRPSPGCLLTYHRHPQHVKLYHNLPFNRPIPFLKPQHKAKKMMKRKEAVNLPSEGRKGVRPTPQAAGKKRRKTSPSEEKIDPKVWKKPKNDCQDSGDRATSWDGRQHLAFNLGSHGTVCQTRPRSGHC